MKTLNNKIYEQKYIKMQKITNSTREIFGLAGAGQSFSLSFLHIHVYTQLYLPSCVFSSIS